MESTSVTDQLLLLVDDEPNVLHALQRLLRNEGYVIRTAAGGPQALEVLKEFPAHVIVADQRMPGMKGVEFFARVKEHFPETVRCVLSGYYDLESITEAINIGSIYKFLSKPWDDDLLKANLADAFRRYHLEHHNRVLAEQLALANEQLELEAAQMAEEAVCNFQMLQATQEVLEHLPVGVFCIDEGGQVLLVNSRAREAIGKDLQPGTFITRIDEPALVEQLRRCVAHIEHLQITLNSGATIEMQVESADPMQSLIPGKIISILQSADLTTH